MRSTDWRAMSAALLRVESLAPDESGLLSFGLHESGGIFVEKGRICWAATRGRARRLLDLLSERSRVDVDALSAVFASCRESGQPLGQALASSGVVGVEVLEQALRRHSAECLLDLCEVPLPMRWLSHPGEGYAPQFTFLAAELWLDAVAVCFPRARQLAGVELATLEAGRRVGAFVHDHESDCWLPVATSVVHSVAELHLLANFVPAIRRARLELAMTPSFTLARTDAEDGALVWSKNGIWFVERCADRASLTKATMMRTALR